MSETTGIIVPGPAQLFSKTGASNTWEFVGWSEQGISPRFRPYHRDIQADYAGDAPADVLYTGNEASVSCRLVKYNEAILMKWLSYLGSSTSIAAGQTLGSDPAGTTAAIGVGTLMNLESASFQLAIQSTFAARSNNAAWNMIPGCLFYAAYLTGETELPHLLGNRVVPVTLRCIPLQNASAGSSQTWTKVLPTLPAVS